MLGAVFFARRFCAMELDDGVESESPRLDGGTYLPTVLGSSLGFSGSEKMYQTCIIFINQDVKLYYLVMIKDGQ